MTTTATKGTLALSFLSQLADVRASLGVTTRDGAALDLGAGLARALDLVREVSRAGTKLIFIGNGGSAAIASHQAIDYTKNGGVPAIAFNDASLLTCIANDFGYERVFAEPLARFAKPGDLLVAISSSGKSKNILNGVEAGRAAGCVVWGLSGFEPGNPLRKLGDLNFYVPSMSYGVVEITHLALIHGVLEEIMLAKACA